MNPIWSPRLQTLELMKMYDRWFSQQELAAPAVCGTG